MEGKMNLKSYRDLEVWQKSMDLAVECYQITKKFPKSEIYGLTSQLRRAAVSIPANIAEGRERQHTKEFIQHLSIAYGSLAELETHILIGQRLNYLDSTQEKQLLEKTAEIGRMINGLRRSLEKKS
jgi:four helix bundle protein